MFLIEGTANTPPPKNTNTNLQISPPGTVPCSANKGEKKDHLSSFQSGNGVAICSAWLCQNIRGCSLICGSGLSLTSSSVFYILFIRTIWHYSCWGRRGDQDIQQRDAKIKEGQNRSASLGENHQPRDIPPAFACKLHVCHLQWTPGSRKQFVSPRKAHNWIWIAL